MIQNNFSLNWVPAADKVALPALEVHCAFLHVAVHGGLVLGGKGAFVAEEYCLICVHPLPALGLA